MTSRIVFGSLLILCLSLALGCKKNPKSTQPDSNPAPYVSSGGGPGAPNQNGNLTVTGGQGAIQSPRMSAARLVNKEQLKQLHLSMFQTWSLDNRVPTVTEIMQEARQNSQLFPLLKEEVIVLTGTKSGDAVWAYPVSATGWRPLCGHPVAASNRSHLTN